MDIIGMLGKKTDKGNDSYEQYCNDRAVLESWLFGSCSDGLQKPFWMHKISVAYKHGGQLQA